VRGKAKSREVRRWDYRTFYISVPATSNDTETLVAALNQYTLAGWQLVSLYPHFGNPTGYAAYCKRPKQ
jgi:hypothetical protein